MEFVNRTGLNFKPGQKLTSNDLKVMNDTINTLVNVVNSLLLRGFYDVNRELNDFNRTFSLTEAIRIVSDSRRSVGMKIRFRALSGKYTEYSYTGASVSDLDFRDTKNWNTGIDVVDGGEW